MRSTAVTRWGLAALALVLLGVLFAWRSSGGMMFSPGELSAASTAESTLGGIASHAELARDCGACHVPAWSGGTMNDRCLACHADVRPQLADTTTLHGALADAEDCRSCHTEHHGADAVLTRLDGLGAWHDQFSFSLAAHETTAGGDPFTCEDCHTGGDFSAAEGECRSCHADDPGDFMVEHVRAWGEECLACHDGLRFATPFDHSSTGYPLVGEHAEVACTACHERAHSLEGFRTDARTCESCHGDDDPHNGEFGNACGECHTASAWEPAQFDHDVFPIGHGARGVNDCDVCHQDGPATYETYTCYGCHEHSPARVRAEHREEGVRDRDIADCVRCHNTREDGELDERADRRERRDGRDREDHEDREDREEHHHDR